MVNQIQSTMNHQLFSTIVNLVSEHTQIHESEIFTRSRKKALVDARYIIIYIARRMDIKLVYIQRFFALEGFELHYTTLFHACNRLEEDMEEDDYIKTLVADIIGQTEVKILTH